MSLIEKEWLALGHPFATRSNSYTNASAFAPVFAHFLSAVWMVRTVFSLHLSTNIII